MKDGDLVLVVKPFWVIDEIHIGKVGILKKLPTTHSFGAISVGKNLEEYRVIVELGGYVPAPSLLKELF